MKNKKKIIFWGLYLIASILIITPPACWGQNALRVCFNEVKIDYKINNVFNIFITLFTNIEIFCIWLATNIIILLFVFDIYLTIRKSKLETKGIKFKTEDGTFGTANWMNEEELIGSLDLGTENGLILGKVGDKIISLPDNTKQNKNVAIFGASRKWKV